MNRGTKNDDSEFQKRHVDLIRIVSDLLAEVVRKGFDDGGETRC